MNSIRTLAPIAMFFALILVIALLACGCTEQAGTQPPAKTPQKQEGGSLTISGSTTVLPIAQAAADAYMDTHPETGIMVTGGGSSVGIQAAGEGTVGIGMSSRDLKAEEKTRYPDLVSTVIGSDGIAIIVHPKNTAGPLTLEQVREIYQGKYKNWKELGGPDMSIVLVGRDSASGTRDFFHEKVMNREDFAAGQLEKNSNGAVKQTVAQTPGAIGYVGLGYIDGTVRAVPVLVNGVPVEPSVRNVLDLKYPVSRPLILVTKGEPAGLARDFIRFLLSSEGQKILEKEGFVPLG